MQIAFSFYNENILSHIFTKKDFISSVPFHKDLFLYIRLRHCIRRTNLPASSHYSLKPIGMENFQSVALKMHLLRGA